MIPDIVAYGFLAAGALSLVIALVVFAIWG